jgi:hypothetical protein
MLNKVVCRKCYQAKRASEPPSFFEEDWEYGKVFCQAGYNSHYKTFDPTLAVFTDVIGTPPDECPYLLEQTLYAK